MRNAQSAATQRPELSLRISALDAYRQSLGIGDRAEPSPFLQSAIEIATVLQAASELERGSERDTLAESCYRQAAELLRPWGTAEPIHDPLGIRSPTQPARGLVGDLYMRGYVRLASHVLESLVRLHDNDEMEQARFLMGRASISAFLGEDDTALAIARQLASAAHRLRSDELKLKLWQRMSSAAKTRGNLPACARAVRRVVKYATRLGDRRSLCWSAYEQAILAGMRGDHSSAIVLHWEALLLTEHPTLVLYNLNNAAHTLFQCGQYRAARAARAVTFSRPVEIGFRTLCLGGYAVACAGLGDMAGVRWASEQTLALLPKMGNGSRHTAQGLLGCADACGEVGLSELARTLYRHGLEMSDRKGYHDLRFWPDPTGRVNASFPHKPLTEDARVATASFEELAPDGVSTTLDLAGIAR